MTVCIACYSERVASLLDGATELRFFCRSAPTQGSLELMRLRLDKPVEALGLHMLLDILREGGVNTLLCGGLTGCSRAALENSELKVHSWIGGRIEAVADAWAARRLEVMRMPGCGWRRQGTRPCTARGGNWEERDMRSDIIAITSEGPGLNDMVDPRFGRAAGFVLVDLASGGTRYVDNGASQALAQGAGIQAAENVAKAGAGVVLSGFVGPKAFAALSAAGITVIQQVEDMTVAQAVERYRQGVFQAAEAPNVHAGGRH